MLYERLVLDLAQAEAALRGGDREAANRHLMHAQDIILFLNMSIHGGSPKTDGYQEEHAAGLIGCGTGNSYHYSKNDSYYAYTDNESIDVAIANHYATVPALAGLPFASLHLGAGAQKRPAQDGVSLQHAGLPEERFHGREDGQPRDRPGGRFGTRERAAHGARLASLPQPDETPRIRPCVDAPGLDSRCHIRERLGRVVAQRHKCQPLALR